MAQVLTEGSGSSCFRCGDSRILVDQYRESAGLYGTAIVRRFVCIQCYSGIGAAAALVDKEIKLAIINKVHMVEGREKAAKTYYKRTNIKPGPKPKSVASPAARVVPSASVPAVQWASPARRLLAYVMRREAKGNGRSSIQHVMKTVDNWMCDGRRGDCVELLTIADPEALTVPVSFGLLAAFEDPEMELLELRKKFVEGLRKKLERTRPADVEILMRGEE